ncbi:MAG TPA: penicillin acylase family protein [Anaeromyxobacteraceae bacterium]|nr:penicillin acylase family protein [Anaeromyxobacteraceae bacterium]
MRRRLAAIALAAALAACQEEAKPQGVPVEATVGTNPALSANVEAIYDGLGMPHIYAQSDGDGAYALGYVHARDRLFQMDLYRRAPRGRLSELFGASFLEDDVAARTIFTGIRETAPGAFEVGRVEDFIAQDLDPQLAAVLQRYVGGVNRFLQDLATGANGARLPIEYVLVTGGVPAIAPWTLEDTVAIGRAFSQQLSFDLDVGYGLAAQAFCAPPRSFADCLIFFDLTRSAPAVGSFVLPPQAPPSVKPLPPGAVASLRGAAARARKPFWLLGSEKGASNNWVVGGSRAASGRPILANDPHLGYENPSIFYLAQISTDTRDVAGVTFPGVPGVLIGHNGKLAFGVTTVGYDVTDTFVEALDTQGRVLHQAPGEPAPTFKPIEVLSEQFGVAGGMPGCPVPCTVSVPIPVVPWHGPILPGSIQGNTALSVQWTGQRPTQEIFAYWQLDGASTVDQAFQALAWFEVGAQNFVLADTAGHIGYDPHAWVPVRPAGCTPWAPMPGDGSCDWTGRIADADLPQAKDPAAGWVATANNDITGSTADGNPRTSPAPYPPDQYLYYTNDLGYRHARIAQRLTEKNGGYTLDDMTSIQADVRSLFAEALVPALLAWWGSDTCATTGAAGSCAEALASRDLGGARDLLAAWAAAGPWQFQMPTGLATTNPAGAASADASEREAAAAAMLFHALVPRLARLILDDDLARYGYSANSWLDSQVMAKYLVALGGYAPGRTPPAVPLNTELNAGISLCRVYDPGTGTFGGETCADMAVLALQEAVAFLSAQPEFGPSTSPQGWLWGRLHRAYFRSNLSPSTTLLDYGPFANDGGLHTVDVANFSWSNDGPGGFTQGGGPNVRFAAEVGTSSIRWRAVIPGGQSGFAGDPNYMDQIPAYLANQPGDQPYARSEVEAVAARRLVFTR